MTAAKVMDIISRLPGCAGQAGDAVSAYTQVEMEDAPTLLNIRKSECPDIWIRLPKHKWPTTWSSVKDPVVPLELNLYGHPLAGLLWERQFEKVLLEHGWEKVPNCELIGKKDEKYWLLGNKVLTPYGKYSWKTLIWENRHHSLTMFFWVVLNENVK